MRSVGTRTLVAAVTAGLAGVLALSGVSSAATAGANQGVTDKSVKIGFIYSKTGVASATSGTSDIGCKARVARENAAGGVNGRKIEVEYADDQSSGANKTAAQDLVQNQHVYMIVNDSAFAFLTYQFLLDSGTPLIGGGYDGTYYGTPGNESIISGLGNAAPVTGVTSDLTAKIAKAQGATKMASIGYGISPSSTAAAVSNGKYAAPAAGLKSVYTNTTVDFGSTDVSPIVLGIKNSGADAAFYAMNANTNLAIAQGLVQNGVKMKAEMMATGYGQQLLDEPSSAQIGPDVLFTQSWAPVEAKTKATKLLQADLKKYADFTGVPDFGIYTGYTDCDLMITGLKQQGKNLDPTTFADGIRKLGKVNPADLSCQPLDFSEASFGQPAPTTCSYAMQVKNGKFVILKPKGGSDLFWTGKLVEKSFTENAATTTTAAPAS
jgi:ABC-type branched-subunit amino acid transport system substrate-binding protein